MEKLELNSIWNGWKITRELGSGAHGRVFLAEKTGTEGGIMQCAVKEILMAPRKEPISEAMEYGITVGELEDYFEIFKENLTIELERYAGVESPCLAKYEECEFAANEDFPGWTGYVRRGLFKTVSERFPGRVTGEREAVRIGKDICKALIEYERNGLVHGGISLSNIMWDDSGRFVLVDHGISKCSITAGTRLFDGERSYDAPEVIARRRYSHASDIYSLGMAVRAAADGGELNDTWRMALSGGLVNIIERAAAQRPRDRYRTAEAFLHDLEEYEKTLPADPFYEDEEETAGEQKQEAELRPDPVPGVIEQEVKEAAEETEPEAEKAPVESLAEEPAAEAETAAAPEPEAPVPVEPEEKSTAAGEDALDKAFQSFFENEPGSEEPEPEAAEKAEPAGKAIKDRIMPVLNRFKTDKKLIAGAAAALVVIALIIALIIAGSKSAKKKENTLPVQSSEASQQLPEQTEASDNTGESNSNAENAAGQNEPAPAPPVAMDGIIDVDADAERLREEAEGDEGLLDSAALPEEYTLDSDIVSDEKLDSMNRTETYLFLDEIYARHGKIFKDKDIQQYFESQEWYTPVTASSEEVIKSFSDTEMDNLTKIVTYQKSKGYR
ncbi:MAG: YARHG domain-containing protein [Oscillospiraceae bacterium]|nr:YARHG domain-containing protein [Oscillospiraceae bacterium]